MGGSPRRARDSLSRSDGACFMKPGLTTGSPDWSAARGAGGSGFVAASTRRLAETLGDDLFAIAEDLFQFRGHEEGMNELA